MSLNFGRLNPTSRSIAWAIIDIILVIVLVLIGVQYEGTVLAGFIVLAVGFVFACGGNVLTFAKCLMFGNESATKDTPEKDCSNESSFKFITTTTVIFTINSIVCFIVGIILMLK